MDRIMRARDKHLAADKILSEEYNWDGMRICSFNSNFVLICIKMILITCPLGFPDYGRH